MIKGGKQLSSKRGIMCFFRVTLVTSVGRALKSLKFTPYYVGLYQILQRIGEVAYQIAFPPPLANFHDVFHVS